MDFIEGLLTSKGKDTICVVVDKFKKYGHFMALSHSYSTLIVAQITLITSSNSMVCLTSLSLSKTKCLPVCFGKKFSLS